MAKCKKMPMRDSKKRKARKMTFWYIFYKSVFFLRFIPNEKGETHNIKYGLDPLSFCLQCDVDQPDENELSSYLHLFWVGFGLDYSYSNSWVPLLRQGDFLCHNKTILISLKSNPQSLLHSGKP